MFDNDLHDFKFAPKPIRPPRERSSLLGDALLLAASLGAGLVVGKLIILVLRVL